jgi:hypothetical protein
MAGSKVIVRFIAAAGAAALLALAGAPASADAVEETQAQLRAEGYGNIEVERTLLGRIRITAESATRRREIVIDRGTGEILRDLTEERPTAPPADSDG